MKKVNLPSVCLVMAVLSSLALLPSACVQFEFYDSKFPLCHNDTCDYCLRPPCYLCTAVLSCKALFNRTDTSIPTSHSPSYSLSLLFQVWGPQKPAVTVVALQQRVLDAASIVGRQV